MKVLTWKDKETGIYYRAALVPNNKTTDGVDFKVEQQSTDFTGCVSWTPFRSISMESLARAVMDGEAKVEE